MIGKVCKWLDYAVFTVLVVALVGNCFGYEVGKSTSHVTFLVLLAAYLFEIICLRRAHGWDD